MQNRKDCIAMLLAGGQGSRLYALTNSVAKPAVSFGAKYRIIDFTLSNCINSQIDTVGVLTQYQPMLLNDYIGNGQPWDMDRLFGGVHVLPPYQAKGKSDWYLGTANAIYQNLHFVRTYNPDYVLILSGDHIYNMDYSKLKKFHIQNDADITIATITVPIEQASRFGILTADNEGRITQFVEKPKHPTSTLASMGVYMFNTNVLFDYLEQDAMNDNSSHDFGKDIIPKLLQDNARMYAYRFDGYWKDVGTLESLWEANMDLLTEKPAFDIFESKWKIHSRNKLSPPIYNGDHCCIENAIIGGGSSIYGKVTNSILGKGVIVHEGAVVNDSLLFDNVIVHQGATVDYSIIDEQVSIGSNSAIGQARSEGNGLTVIARGVVIAEDKRINGGIIEEAIL
ncbi:MAG: glucose-1-phosphate adenylyltransferase [Clostridia bacterium]|nr:glucose-1-phosphate adenylyltransferase [Clostridia bacterium]